MICLDGPDVLDHGGYALSIEFAKWCENCEYPIRVSEVLLTNWSGIVGSAGSVVVEGLHEDEEIVWAIRWGSRIIDKIPSSHYSIWKSNTMVERSQMNFAQNMVKLGDNLVNVHLISCIDISRIEEQIVTVFTTEGKQYEAYGFDAVELVLQIKPSALEGRRMKWRKGAWAFHNIFGHWGLQILVWLGFKKAGIRWHDYTTPRARDLR